MVEKTKTLVEETSYTSFLANLEELCREKVYFLRSRKLKILAEECEALATTISAYRALNK